MLIIFVSRSNLAMILLTDLVVDGLDLDCHSVDWSMHMPLMLHIIFLGLGKIISLVIKARSFISRAKGWIEYGMDSKFKLGDLLKNFRTV